MQEALLQFVWRLQLFHNQVFTLSDGRKLLVLSPGRQNANQGPDFLYARLEIDGIQWVGSVECHIDGQSWYLHSHHKDSIYNSVILHVVLKKSTQIPCRKDGTEITELVVSLPEAILEKYQQFLKTENSIPCSNFHSEIPPLLSYQWFTRLGVERFERKKNLWLQQKPSDIDYLDLLWRATAEAIAGPINRQAFGEMAQHIPFSIIRQYRHQIIQLHALLFGVARLIPEKTTEDYPKILLQEWHYLQQKHQLTQLNTQCYFFRIRPIAFPTIRIAQLAAIIQFEPYWQLTNPIIPNIDKQFLNQHIHHYWKTHYVFEKETKPHNVSISDEVYNRLIINAFLPIQWSYFSKFNPEQIDYYLNLLEKIPPEQNQHTAKFKNLEFKPRCILHSQGMIECITQYCQPQKCLECQFGQKILSPKTSY